VAGEELLVVPDVVRVWRPQPAHGHHDQLHGPRY
jgi:hypothetical protein